MLYGTLTHECSDALNTCSRVPTFPSPAVSDILPCTSVLQHKLGESLLLQPKEGFFNPKGYVGSGGGRNRLEREGPLHNLAKPRRDKPSQAFRMPIID